MNAISLFSFLVFVTISELLAVTVHTPLGQVRGRTIQVGNISVDSFLGVPFAQPPIGDLRFQKPQPVKKWSGIYNAIEMPSACIQYITYPFPGYDFEDRKSEDCLYLNIWVPSFHSTRNLSVMVWIYGGGFSLGSIQKEIYDGSTLSAFGDVVVITINYRLGAFGFLTSGTEDAPGNVGIYDMVEALKWVKKYIAAFGGNPKQVTLFGQSAGSISIGLLCVSPLTNGLFQRVIMESGSPAYLSAENNTRNIAISQQLAKAVGCASDDHNIQENPKEVVSCLKGTDATNLAQTLAAFNPSSASFYLPMYGDEVLPFNAREEIIKGKFHKVDVLIGSNRDEGSYRITTANPDIFGFFGDRDAFINKSYAESLIQKIIGSTIPDPEAVSKHYLGDVDDQDMELIRKQLYTASGDYTFLCPSVYFAERYREEGNNVHYYFFEHRPSGTTPWAEWMGVAHFEEIQFVFGMPLQQPLNYTRQEKELSTRMIKIWSDFAKIGKPSPNWPLYSREKPIYVKLNVAESTEYELDSIPKGHGPHKNNCDFFKEYFGYK